MEAERLVGRIMKFAIVMTVLGLAVGVFYREATKYLLKGVPLDRFILVSTYLSLSHGHFFMIGVLVPMALAAMTWFAKRGLEEADLRSLSRAFTVYVIGALMTLALLTYKGFEMVKLYSEGVPIDALNSKLFLGSQAIRSSLYGTAHLLLGIGLLWYVYVIWRRL